MEHDPELVRRAVAGDPDAVGRLWQSARSWVAASALAHLPAGADLEDLLQDVAMQLVTGIRGLLQPDRFLPWLRTIAVNCARSAGRKAAVRRGCRPIDSADHEIPDPAPDRVAAQATAEQHLQRVLELVGHLPVDLLLAQALAIEETTVETRLARARRLLRRGAPVLARNDKGCAS